MTLAYRRAASPASSWDAWGSVAFGTTRIALRRVVVFGGVALLLLTLLIRTGEAGLAQLVASVLFGVPLLAVGSLTRTVGLPLLGRLLFIGVALVGVMYLLALVVITPLMEFSRPRVFVVPAIEQLLVMAPLVALLWRWRSGRTWSLGATDLLLAGVAVGIGFALVEESYIRQAGGDTYLAWLPVVAEDAGRVVGGHPLWAGLGGATLGLGLLVRSRGPIWRVVAISGSVLAFVDHAAHNNHVSWGDDLAGLLNVVTLSGWLPVAAFLALVAGCIGADIAVQRRLPRRPVPPRAPGLAGLFATWELLSLRRRLAIADFHRRQLPEAISQAAEREARGLDGHLAASRPHEAGPGGRGDATGGGMLLVLSLVGVGLAGLAGLLAEAAALLPAVVILAILDVGSNCDPWCLLSSGGGLGGSAGPSEEEEQEEEEEEDEGCEAQQAAVDAAEARCTGLEALIDALSGQLAGTVAQAQALMAQLQAMLPGLIGDPVAGGAAADLFGALGTAQQQPADGAGGAAASEFFGTAGPMLHGPISGAQGLFPAALPPSQALAAGALALLAQLQSTLTAGAALANNLQDAEGDLQRCRADLAEAQEALARCLAARR